MKYIKAIFICNQILMPRVVRDIIKKTNKHTNILFCYDQMTCCSDHFARNPGIDKSFIYNSINAEQFTASRKDATKYD